MTWKCSKATLDSMIIRVKLISVDDGRNIGRPKKILVND